MQEKRGNREQQTQKSNEKDSSKFLQDEDVRIFKVLLERLKEKYNLSSTDILNLTREELTIPCTIFIDKLSPLETVVKYMKENLDLDYSKTAELLNRNRKIVWQTYKNAVGKFPKKITAKETDYNIPVSVFRTKLSILEAVVVYLKDNFELSYHKMGELLQRNERTVWTVYNRAQKKNVGK
ncbi:hypothetical protein GOV06_04900 [Candidatus Woesearchaeota archaeon]|nr:hypothetical protein [Candidatus Woesearchaeota archaeon]